MRAEVPCKGCTKRQIEPNCHNVEICPEWAEYMKAKIAEKEKVSHERYKYYDNIRQIYDSCKRNKSFKK